MTFRFGRTEHPLCEMSRSYKPQIEISDLDQKKLQFLIKSPPNQQAVAKQLEVVYGNPIWPKKTKSTSLTVECTLTSETKDCQQLLGTWETNVKEKLNLFLDQLLVVKHTTLQEAYPLVLNKLMTLTIRNPDTVAVVLEKSSNELYVTGYRQAVTDVSHQVGEIIHKIMAENGFTQGGSIIYVRIASQINTTGSISSVFDAFFTLYKMVMYAFKKNENLYCIIVYALSKGALYDFISLKPLSFIQSNIYV